MGKFKEGGGETKFTDIVKHFNRDIIDKPNNYESKISDYYTGGPNVLESRRKYTLYFDSEISRYNNPTPPLSEYDTFPGMTSENKYDTDTDNSYIWWEGDDNLFYNASNPYPNPFVLGGPAATYSNDLDSPAWGLPMSLEHHTTSSGLKMLKYTNKIPEWILKFDSIDRDVSVFPSYTNMEELGQGAIDPDHYLYYSRGGSDYGDPDITTNMRGDREGIADKTNFYGQHFNPTILVRCNGVPGPYFDAEDIYRLRDTDYWNDTVEGFRNEPNDAGVNLLNILGSRNARIGYQDDTRSFDRTRNPLASRDGYAGQTYLRLNGGFDTGVEPIQTYDSEGNPLPPELCPHMSSFRQPKAFLHQCWQITYGGGDQTYKEGWLLQGLPTYDQLTEKEKFEFQNVYIIHLEWESLDIDGSFYLPLHESDADLSEPDHRFSRARTHAIANHDENRFSPGNFFYKNSKLIGPNDSDSSVIDASNNNPSNIPVLVDDDDEKHEITFSNFHGGVNKLQIAMRETSKETVEGYTRTTEINEYVENYQHNWRQSPSQRYAQRESQRDDIRYHYQPAKNIYTWESVQYSQYSKVVHIYPGGETHQIANGTRSYRPPQTLYAQVSTSIDERKFQHTQPSTQVASQYGQITKDVRYLQPYQADKHYYLPGQTTYEQPVAAETKFNTTFETNFTFWD